MTTFKKSILITGASSGIGKYIAEVLARRGWIVWAGYRDLKNKEELLKISPDNVRPLLIDVTDINSIVAAQKIIENSEILLNVLFNNAGIALGGPIEALDIEEIKKVYDVNFFGCVRMIQAFLPLLRKSSGRIINMSSLAGLISPPFLTPYSSSKFAVEGMSDGLRRELLNHNIQVSIIEPGPIRTDIWKKSLRQSDDVLENYSDLTAPYQPAIDNFISLLQKSNSFSVSLTKLKRVIIHASESAHPKIRYLVYRNNFILSLFIKIMPAKFLDFFFKKLLKY